MKIPRFVFFSLIIIGILGFLIQNRSFLTNDKSSKLSATPQASNLAQEMPTVSPSSENMKWVDCENMQARFQIPSTWQKREENNSKGEFVCIMSRQFSKDGTIPTGQAAFIVFATQKSMQNEGMTSRKAAEAGILRYGGAVDLPEEVLKKGTAFTTFRALLLDDLSYPGTIVVHTVANEATDTYYSLAFAIPSKSDEKELPSIWQITMDGYILDKNF